MASILQVISVIIKKPAVAAVLGVIAGLALGLIFGWVIWPVQWTDATPEVLRADLQEDYMRMAIDSFRVNGDQILAIQRIAYKAACGGPHSDPRTVRIIF